MATRPACRLRLVRLGGGFRLGLPHHAVPATHLNPHRPLRGHVGRPRWIGKRVDGVLAGVEPLVPARGALLGVPEVVDVGTGRPQHHASAGDDTRPQVVDVGRVGAHVAAVQAEHDGRRGRGQEPVGPDGRVRPGEGQPADRVDAGVDVAHEVDGEFVPGRRDGSEAQFGSGRVRPAHPGGQPARERPPGLGARDLRAQGEELPQRFRVGAARHADDPGEPADDPVARSHYGP